MTLTREEWLKQRADRYREMIKDMQNQIAIMERGGFYIRERTADTPWEDVTGQVIEHEREMIADLQKQIDYIEGQLQG